MLNLLLNSSLLSFLEGHSFEIGIVVAIVGIIIGARLFRPNAPRTENRPKQDAPSQNTDLIEQDVASTSELKNGECKEVPVGEGQVLLVKDNDEFFAVGHKCTHYGAPLKNGAVGEGRIRCPWHGACFNLKTGDIEDFPCVDAIHAFKTRVEGGRVFVAASQNALKNTKRTPKMASKVPSDNRLFAIIGGGPAGLTAAETLRQEGFTGRIIVLSKEKDYPYDRTKLSKAMGEPASKILLRPAEFFAEHDIEFQLNSEVASLDAKSKTITLKNGDILQCDKIVIATGGNPRTLPVPGMNLGNIYQLRVPEEAQAIVNGVNEKKVVIVGTSFIGMEAAACVAKKAASVIAIGMEKVPFERVLGAEIGAALQKLHEENGIKFRLEKVVKEFKGQDGRVTAVVLNDGEELEADICIIGAGIVPATGYIKPDTLQLFRDNSIIVDQYMKAAEDVYAVGDLARFPFWLFKGEHIRVEHYGMAQYQAKIAALNMLGKNVPVNSVPFFWTTQYGKSVRYAGHALSFDSVIIDGDLNGYKFVAYYVKGDEVLAVASMGRDPIVSKAAELMQSGKLPTAADIRAGKFIQ